MPPVLCVIGRGSGLAAKLADGGPLDYCLHAVLTGYVGAVLNALLVEFVMVDGGGQGVEIANDRAKKNRQDEYFEIRLPA